MGVPFAERKKSVRACILSLFLVTTYTKKRLHTVDFKEAKTSYKAGHKLSTIRIRKIRFHYFSLIFVMLHRFLENNIISKQNKKKLRLEQIRTSKSWREMMARHATEQSDCARQRSSSPFQILIFETYWCSQESSFLWVTSRILGARSLC